MGIEKQYGEEERLELLVCEYIKTKRHEFVIRVAQAKGVNDWLPEFVSELLFYGQYRYRSKIVSSVDGKRVISVNRVITDSDLESVRSFLKDVLKDIGDYVLLDSSWYNGTEENLIRVLNAIEEYCIGIIKIEK